MFVPISSTKISRWASTCSATITFQAALKNSSRSSAPTVSVFLGEAHPLHKAPYGGVAKGRGGYVLQEAASLADGGSWALLYILLQEGLGFLRYYAGSSWALSGLKRPSLASHPRVALDLKERLTSKVRAAWAFDIPRSMAATIFLRRSSE